MNEDYFELLKDLASGKMHRKFMFFQNRIISYFIYVIQKKLLNM